MRKIALFCLILMGGVISISAQQPGSVIQVVGKASLKVKPENMVLNIPVTVKNYQFADCSNELMDVMEILIDDLVETGIDSKDIKNDDLSIVEDFEYNGRIREKVGYVGRVTIHVEQLYSADIIEDLIDVLSLHELDHSLYFTLSEKQIQNLTDQAIKEAIADAKLKAKVIADEAGVELETISRISYDYRGRVADPLLKVAMNEVSVRSSGKDQIQFNPMEESIEKQVQIEWVISND